MRLLVDSTAFMACLADDIRQARSTVSIQVMSFEGDTAGRQLAALLLGRKDLERTLIVDRYSLWILSDRFLMTPRNVVRPSLWLELLSTRRLVDELRRDGVCVRWTNPVGPLLFNFAGRNHKKQVLIDDRIAYLGGINACDHNFDWHDLMLRIEDEQLGTFLREDLQATLRGENLSLRRDFGDVEIILLDGVDNPRLCQPILQLIREARRSIIVHSPYLSFPFYDHLADAVRRGVSVTHIAPERNNKPKISGYTQWAAERAGLSLRLYRDRMSHLKAMLIDEEILIIGSVNFDFLTFHTQQEIAAIVRDPETVRQFQRDVVDADLARSVPPARSVNRAFEVWRDRGFRGGAWLVVAASRAYSNRRKTVG